MAMKKSNFISWFKTSYAVPLPHCPFENRSLEMKRKPEKFGKSTMTFMDQSQLSTLSMECLFS
jgi:hypothetical protein